MSLQGGLKRTLVSTNRDYEYKPPQPVEPDMTLLFLGSFFEDLQHAPVSDDAKLDAHR